MSFEVKTVERFDDWERTTTFKLGGPKRLKPIECANATEVIKTAIDLEGIGYSILDFHVEWRKATPPPLDN